MPNVVALLPTDLRTTRLGLPSMVDRDLSGCSVLQHTVRRVTRVPQVDCIVLVHPEGQDPASLIAAAASRTPVMTFADPLGLTDPWHAWRTASRKWALGAWRGGLGGSTCYDELLPAGQLTDAMHKFEATSALLVGGDWPLVDPELCRRVLERHLDNPDAMKMTFTQAPPGLAGIAIGLDLLKEISEKCATFGRPLAYVPQRPQADAIGLDCCVQIPAAVRSCGKRFIYDTRRSAVMVDALAEKLGAEFEHADAMTVAHTTHSLSDSLKETHGFLPQEITLEVNAERRVNGPLVPQHHVNLHRSVMPLPEAIRILSEAGSDNAGGDVAVTIGGLGDALLYEPLAELVNTAHEAGVFGIALESDLLVDQQKIDLVLSLPVDVLSVRMNADTARTYQAVMGSDDFGRVIANIEYFLNRRAKASVADKGRPMGLPGVPWLVPRLIKTNQTTSDLETFFDRWVHFAGHAVIEPATTGRGSDQDLMPVLSPVKMSPPRRQPCRQLMDRMTIHCDGVVPRCDQDWLAANPMGDVSDRTLVDIWSEGRDVRDRHRAEKWDQVALCTACSEWHRP